MEVQNKVNKKGSFFDLIIMVAIAFGLVIAFIFITTITDQLNVAFQDTPIGQSNYSNTTMQQTTSVTHNLDFITLTVFICLFIVTILFAVYIPANPIFIPIFIIFGIIGVIICIPLSSGYEEFAENSALSATVNSYYPITDIIMSNLPIFFAAFTAILLIITYVKGSSEGGGM
jgi:hypothetical protein